jgi:DNA invertase Pin-like site-specific DNA recombinase
MQFSSTTDHATFDVGNDHRAVIGASGGVAFDETVVEKPIRAYLRASTHEQDANRAKDQLRAFATERGMAIAAWYVENESGAKLARPELFRLLNDSSPGDILLLEQVDRLSRLNASDWESLRAELATRKVRVVALDLPTSWVMTTGNGDEFTARMFDAINGMMLDMLAAIARKDYEDRRRRQSQGIARAIAEGLYRGRPEDIERNANIATMLKAGLSYSAVQAATGCSRATVAKIAKRIPDRPFEVASV